MWLFKIIQKSISLYNAMLENMLMWRHFKSDNKSERLRGESMKSRHMYWNIPQDNKE